MARRKATRTGKGKADAEALTAETMYWPGRAASFPHRFAVGIAQETTEVLDACSWARKHGDEAARIAAEMLDRDLREILHVALNAATQRRRFEIRPGCLATDTESPDWRDFTQGMAAILAAAASAADRIGEAGEGFRLIHCSLRGNLRALDPRQAEPAA